MNHTRPVALLLLTVFWGCSGGSGAPTAPTAGPSVVTGRILNAVTHESVGPGVKLSIPELGVTSETDSAGGYRLEFAARHNPIVKAEVTGFWPRTFAVRPGTASLDFDILPQGDGFDLTFFDDLFRQEGRGQTAPLETARIVVTIYPQWFDCADGFSTQPLNTCNTTGGTPDVIARQPLDEIAQFTRDVVESDTPLFTGGRIQAIVTIGPLFPQGTRMPITDLTAEGNQRDTFGWAFVEGGYAGTAGDPVIVKPSNRDSGFFRSTTSHELGHKLGFGHLELDTPHCSIMGQQGCPEFVESPTAADMLHGRIFYSRPPGVLSPDDYSSPLG